MDIFKGTDIGIMPFVDYVSLYLDKENANYNLVQLPPIQRNAVWKVAQIERLWDTILRGFPIGSFLVSKRAKGEQARKINSAQQIVSENEGFFLLDGQQRTRAILLGFMHSENARLWIDLNPKLTFGNAEHNDRQFLLRVTSTYQPWGMKQSHPEDKLNEHQKYSERIKLFGKSVRYDYQVNINTPTNNDISSYPIESNLPVPLDELIHLCGGYCGSFREPSWQEVAQFIPPQKESVTNIEPAHFKKVIKALKRLLDSSERNSEKRSVALLLQNGDLGIDEEEENDNENERQQEAIEVLFRRVNSGGTTLAGEEMQYSILKANWDGAYEMVSSIVQDKEIGYLYSPTGLVMAASRLARFINEENDIPNPNVNNFRRWVGEKNSPFIGTMKELLDTSDSNNQSILKNVIKLFCGLTLYKEQVKEDIGLPRKFLTSHIDKKYFQPVLTWIYQNRNEPSNIENSKLNILRYLIFASFGFQKNVDEVTKKALEIIRNAPSDVFPDTLIYTKCKDKDLAVKVPDVKQFSETLSAESREGFLRYWHEVIGGEANEFRAFREIFWQKKELLLWFQRYHCSIWFQGYNPMSDDAFDTPYDYDHILPKSHIIISGGSNRLNSDDEQNGNRFYYGRSAYVNSLGNYRVWPNWSNRADGNRCQSEKLRLGKDDLSSDEIAQELQLKSTIDFLVASQIPIEDLELWNNASGTPRDWNEMRRKHWQSAVENRVINLFSIFYNTFEFHKWRENP